MSVKRFYAQLQAKDDVLTVVNSLREHFPHEALSHSVPDIGRTKRLEFVYIDRYLLDGEAAEWTKTLRRLSRGKPRFSITHFAVTEVEVKE